MNHDALAVTIDEVLQLHAEIMTKHHQPYSARAGRRGLYWLENYTSTVAASSRSAMGQIDPLHYASDLLYYIAKGHCFTDGNKRIAWAIAIDVLLRFGLDVESTDDDAVGMVNDLIAQEESASFVIEWFAAPGRLKPYREVIMFQGLPAISPYSRRGWQISCPRHRIFSRSPSTDPRPSSRRRLCRLLIFRT